MASNLHFESIDQPDDSVGGRWHPNRRYDPPQIRYLGDIRGMTLGGSIGMNDSDPNTDQVN